MVQIAPNRARLSGTVVSVEDTGDPSGFIEVAIQVTDISSIPRTRNMFEQQPGEVLGVLMPAPLVARLNLRSGVKLEADVRRVDLHRSFVHPERIRIAPDGHEIRVGDETPAGESPPDHGADDATPRGDETTSE